MPSKKLYFFKLISTILTIGAALLSGGVAQAAPYVTAVNYINPTTVAVVFSENMAAASTATTTAYTLRTGFAGGTTTTTTAGLQPDNRTLELTAYATSISPSMRDSVSVVTGVNAPKNAASQSQTTPWAVSPLLARSADVVISEVQTQGATANDEFIELYNATGSAVSLANYRLSVIDSLGTETNLLANFTATSSIPARGFFLVAKAGGYDGAVAADNTYAAGSVGANSAIVLYGSTSTTTKDMLGFGSTAFYEGFEAFNQGLTNGEPPTNGSLERKAHKDATATSMASGADVNKGNGYDDNVNKFDFVLQTTSNPQNTASPTETLSGVNNNYGGIDHMPLYQVDASADAIIFARAMDPESSPKDLTFQLKYKLGTDANWSTATTTTGAHVANGIFAFRVPGAEIPQQASAFSYYFKLTDTPIIAGGSTNTMCFASSGTISDCSTETTAQSNAWSVNGVSIAAWDNTISGFVKDVSNNPIPNALVFLQGTGIYTTSAANGTFTLSNVYGGSFTVMAVAGGYGEGMMNGVSVGGGSTSSGWTFNLYSGGGGGGGDMDKPMIAWSAPPDQMMSAPLDLSLGTTPMLLGFTKVMDTSTISTSTILVKQMISGTATDVTTTLGINIAYDSGSGVSIGGTTYNFGTNVAVLYSNSDLTTNTQYLIELLPSVMDTAGNTLQGNRPGGGQTIFFNTGGSFNQQQVQQNFGSGGQYMPPYVAGSVPMPGAFNIATNTKFNVLFSQAMSSNSISTNTIKLYSVTAGAETLVSAAVGLDANTKKIVTVTPSADLTASTAYRLKVLGGCMSSSGIQMSNPGTDPSGTQVMFFLDFTSGSGSDGTGPTVKATSLQIYSSGGNITNVPVGLGVISIGFSEAVNPSTITTANITLKAGTTSVTGTVDYDPPSQSANFMPSAALSPNTSYTLTVTASVQDLASNALTLYTQTFTTGTSDTTSPQLAFMDADNWVAVLNFNEPMRAANASDTQRWASSALNPSNYTLRYGASGTSFAKASGGTLISISSATLSYDAEFNSVKIEGLNLASDLVGQEIWVLVENATDLSGNTINVSNDEGRATIKNSQTTYGMMGPGDCGAMGPGGMGPDMGKMGMMGINVKPMNAMANAATVYFIDLPLTKQIPDTGQIVLTFPTGFKLSTAAKDTYSPMVNDINGPGPGTPTVSTVAGDDVAHTLTLTLSGATGGTAGPDGYMDFIHIDIKQITNSAIPKDFNTSGYTVTIKTKNASGSVLESLTSQPFFISEGGQYIISGTVTASGATNVAATSTTTIYLGSPMTGPSETTITFTGAGNTQTYSFASLPAGEYNLFTKPIISLTADGSDQDFSGSLMPEPIRVPDTVSTNYNAGTKTYTRNITLAKANTGVAITPKIYANFSSLTSATDRQIDIFASSPIGFTVKTVSLNQSNYSVTPWNNDGSIKLYLPTALTSGTQIWRVGVGPAMPQGPMFMGPPPLPNWMPPAPQEITVTGGVPPTASPSTFSFTITQATHQIIGYVHGSGSAVPDAEVFAHKPMGDFGMPMHTKTNSTTGQFTLRVTPGTYALGVFKPGLPPSPEMMVKVQDNNAANNGIDSNTSADIYKEGGILITDSATLILKVQKPSFTISGKVSDGTNPVAYAPVWAYNQTTGAMVNSGTDSNGQYIIYANEGTWKVAAHIPGTGDLPPISVVVNATNCPNSACENKTIRPGVTSFATVTGRVFASADATYNAGEEITNAYVWLTGTDSSGNTFNGGTNVSPDGAYSLKTPGGTGYVVHCWTPDYGELAVITLGSVTAGSNYSSQNFRVNTGAVGTFTFSFSATGGLPAAKGFVDVYNASTALGDGVEFSDISATINKTITVPTGSYTVYAYVDGFGKIASTDSNPITLTNAGKALTFNLPAAANQLTISGRVFIDVGGTVGQYDGGTDTAVGDALVWFDNPTAAIHLSVKSNTTSGLYSTILPAGTYTVGADAPGYSGGTPTSVAFSINTTRNFIVTANANTISGSIRDSAGTKVADAWVWADKVVSATDLTFDNGWVATVALGGDYALSLSTGYWWIHAVADGYQESWLTSAVYAGASTNPTSQDLTLTAMSNFSVANPTMRSIIPAKGGVVDDTAVSGIKLFIPPGALGTDTNNAKITIRETYNVPDTRSQEPMGSKAYDVIITDNSGTRLTDFNEPIIMETRYNQSDLGSMDESQLSFGFIDDSHQWSSVNAVIDTTNNIIRASMDHFSATAPTGPSDVSAPATPATPSAAAGASYITVSWSANTEGDLAGYEVYRSTSLSGTFSNISGDSYAGGSFNAATLIQTTCNSGTCSWNDSTALNGITYFYKTAAFDTLGNYSQASSASSAATRGGGGGPYGGTVGGGLTYVPPAEAEVTPPVTTTPSVLSAALSEGGVFKTADSDKVYLIVSGKRLWLPSAAAFEAAGYQWSAIQTVASADLDTAADATLFKTADSAKVYAISQGLRRHIPSVAVFESYSYNWADIVTVASTEANAYPEVSLLKLADDSMVYVLGKGLRRHIPSPEIFEAYGYKWAEIITVNATEMNTYGEAQLIKGIGNVKVYQLINGKRHHIASPAVFNSHGFKWDEIMEINDTELVYYSEDAAISE